MSLDTSRAFPLRSQAGPQCRKPGLHLRVTGSGELGERAQRALQLMLSRCRGALQATALAQGLVGLLPQLAALSDILPPPTLAWKLQLLEEGNRCATC